MSEMRSAPTFDPLSRSVGMQVYPEGGERIGDLLYWLSRALGAEKVTIVIDRHVPPTHVENIYAGASVHWPDTRNQVFGATQSLLISPGMTPNITASTASSKAEFYEDLESQIQGIVDGQRNWVTNLANASALIYHGLRAVTAKPINWAGFYVLDKDVATSSSTSTEAEIKPKKEALILGPFQGKVACTNIVFGRGVCGTAAAENRTLVVKDVHDFPGHIACDSASNSEIVVPLELDGRVIGVLDLDCEVTEGFDEVDKAGLEAVAKILVEACDWRGVV